MREEPKAAPPDEQIIPTAFSVTKALRYDEWYGTMAGSYALRRKEALLRRLLSGWPRRSRSMLIMGAGTGFFVESMWHSGFDVTGQEQDREKCAIAREMLGSRAEMVFAQPEDLPFDDGSFDYAVAVDSFEFWDNPEEALIEMRRVACVGAILIFPNTWSFLGMRSFFAPGKSGYGSMRSYLYSGRKVQQLAGSLCGQCKTSWLSTLLTPPCAWRKNSILDLINSVDIRFILGGFAGVRIDFDPFAAGTPLAVPVRQTVSSRS